MVLSSATVPPPALTTHPTCIPGPGSVHPVLLCNLHPHRQTCCVPPRPSFLPSNPLRSLHPPSFARFLYYTSTPRLSFTILRQAFALLEQASSPFTFRLLLSAPSVFSSGTHTSTRQTNRLRQDKTQARARRPAPSSAPHSIRVLQPTTRPSTLLPDLVSIRFLIRKSTSHFASAATSIFPSDPKRRLHRNASRLSHFDPTSRWTTHRHRG